jgi:hypothetical protein
MARLHKVNDVKQKTTTFGFSPFGTNVQQPIHSPIFSFSTLPKYESVFSPFSFNQSVHSPTSPVNVKPQNISDNLPFKTDDTPQNISNNLPSETNDEIKSDNKFRILNLEVKILDNKIKILYLEVETLESKKDKKLKKITDLENKRKRLRDGDEILSESIKKPKLDTK